MPTSREQLLAGLGRIVATLVKNDEVATITASVHAFKPYKRRKLKTDMFHRLMRTARRYKKPTVQQLYKQRIARKKWSTVNRTALRQRRMFVEKARKHLGLKAALMHISTRC